MKSLPPTVKLAIVVAEFNSEITEKMLKQALKQSSELGTLVTYVCRVPGAFDMPVIIQALLEKDDVDAVVTLGAVVQGETKHDEVIAHALAFRVAELSLRYKKPVAFGVAGPGMKWEQGEARSEDYANRSVTSALTLVLRLREVEKPHKAVYPVVIE